MLPGVEVRIAARPRAADGEVAHIRAESYGADLVLGPGRSVPAEHRLLAAAVEEVGVPPALTVDIHIASDVPPGASTGTSAAVAVALIGALDALTPGRMGPAALAAAAHRVEVDRLGLQSGVQDQLASAYGGINHIVIDAYPRARVEPLRMDPALRDQLDRRLVVAFLGRAHHSSAVHDKVIAELADEGPRSPRLEALRRLAVSGRDALAAGDLIGFGRAMVENTDAQAELHPFLVSDDAWRVIDQARAHDALGWKVNGAGGAGGSLTVLLQRSSTALDDLRHAVTAADPCVEVRPVRLSLHGLGRWET